MKISDSLFPFTAVIGQADLKLGLILNAVHPGIGGILIRGEKGTAKSTIVRGLTRILPPVKVRPGCGYNCRPGGVFLCPDCRAGSPVEPVSLPRPVVTLPLNATEDRVAGGLDFDRAVRQGKKILQPGLLAAAHRGILYVDEINLLDDHIVDIILDAAASGENRIEREGISFFHPSRFILVGTMNPEEGDLRPQLLDRFGLCIEVSAEQDPETRIELMVRRDRYDRDPNGFIRGFESETVSLAGDVQNARARLPRVKVPAHLRHFIAELTASRHVAGHRADLVIEQAARAHAAWTGKVEVDADDISRVAPFALIHREQTVSPPPPPPPPRDSEDQNQDQEKNQDQGQDREAGDDPEQNPHESNGESRVQAPPLTGDAVPDPDERDADAKETGDPSKERIFEIGAPFKVKKISTVKDRRMRKGSGRRSRSRVSQKQGRYIRSGNGGAKNDLAFDATLRAAAPHQQQRVPLPGMCISLRAEDIREKIREKRMGNFLIFLVDASGSMGARGRMTASKGAVLSLLLDAYQKRDRVAMISFRKDRAYVNLPPTSSIELAAQYLEQMPVGGRTPLSAGLDKAHHMVGNALLRDPAARPIVMIITDGRSNVALGREKPVDEAMAFARRMGRDERVKYIVVDTESRGLVRFGLAGKLAAAANAEYCRLDDLRADALTDLVRNTN